MDQNAVAKHWGDRGFSCGFWVDAAGQIWADFVHDVDELVMVVEGGVEFEIDSRTHRHRSGEELLVPGRTTIRRTLLERAGRLTRPGGQLTLTMSANATGRGQLLHYLAALRPAA